MRHLKYGELEMQNYFKSDSSINTKLAREMFIYRTRMIKVRNNYKKSGKNECPLCNKNEDTQEHLLKCQKNTYNIKEIGTNNNISYTDIFSNNSSEILRTVTILQKAMEDRKELIKENCIKEKIW